MILSVYSLTLIPYGGRDFKENTWKIVKYSGRMLAFSI